MTTTASPFKTSKEDLMRSLGDLAKSVEFVDTTFGNLSADPAHPDGLNFLDRRIPFHDSWGRRSFLRALGIPASYFDKCSNALKHINVTEWKDTLKEKKIRLVLRGGELAGVVSPRYTTAQGVEIVDRILSDTKLSVSNYHVCSSYGHVRMLDPTTTRDISAKVGTKAGDDISMGLDVFFSDVGRTQFLVELLLFRLVCTNGVIRRIESRPLAMVNYLSLTPEKCHHELTSSGDRFRHYAPIVTNRFIETANEKLTPEQANQEIRLITGANSDRSPLVQQVQERYAIDSGNSRFHVLNAFTRVVQQHEPIIRSRMERVAGNYLGALPE